ncbi:MAG: cobalamin biosynthesis protein CobD [Actinobacteria bacterium RBG_19FT_COMBO_54_7]|nr:MAG: cobalamin biosynthesis protein CobD [Actinobacteria bacterium RBG_19FT_COMBO_54_7]
MELIIAYLLDALIGDPEIYPHPVRIIGRSIDYLQPRLRMGDRDAVAAGGLLAATVVGGTYGITRLLVAVAPGFADTAFLYTAIARKDLERSALRVAEALEENDLASAREGLKALAGRDVDKMDNIAICRAAVESVAENFVDGVLAPMLWGATAGAPGAMAFKAVSTLDSMIGHDDETHRYIGKLSARLDDLAVFPSARIALPLIVAASAILRLDAAAALKIGLRDRKNHPSPNSAHAEASFAGALGLTLGGPSDYGGLRRDLPEIGEGTSEVEPRHIREAVRLLNIASLLALSVAVLLSGRGGRWK